MSVCCCTGAPKQAAPGAGSFADVGTSGGAAPTGNSGDAAAGVGALGAPAPAPAGGGKGAAIVAAARAEIGTMSSDSLKYVKAGGGTALEPWCGDFVEAMYQKNGLDKPPARSVPKLLAWANEHGKMTKDPSQGDLVMFDWDHDGTPDHVGIVESRDGDQVHTIEGNTTTKGGLGVAEKTRDMSTIVGFVDTV